MTTDLNRFDDELFWSTPDAGLDRPVIGIIAASGGTLMFDACSSHRHAVELKQALGARGLRPPDYAVISHSHADHWFGLVDFETVSVCSRACQAATKAMTTMDWSHDGYRRLVDDGDGQRLSRGHPRRGIRQRPGAHTAEEPRRGHPAASSRSISAAWWWRSARSRAATPATPSSSPFPRRGSCSWAMSCICARTVRRSFTTSWPCWPVSMRSGSSTRTSTGS